MEITDLGKVAVVYVRDNLDWFSISELRSKVITLMAQERKDIVLDLAEAKYIDSYGIGVLVFLTELLRRHARTLKFTGMRPSTIAMIERSHPSLPLRKSLEDVWEIYDNLGQAVASVGS